MTLKLHKNYFIKFITVFLFVVFAFNKINANGLKEGNTNSSSSDILQLEAVFITKFVNFIEWPAESKIENKGLPFTITILGNHPFKNMLQQIYDESGIRVLNKNIEIKYIKSIEELSYTNILFIGKSEKTKLKEITSSIKSKPILTIADTKGFAENNVHINFYLKTNNTLHFEINEHIIKESPLTMSVRLLSIAKIVGGKF